MDKETPGLGTKASEPAWMAQFFGKTLEQIPLSPQDFKKQAVDAISGATLTSLAVVRDLSDALKTVYEISGVKVETTGTQDSESGASPRGQYGNGGR